MSGSIWVLAEQWRGVISDIAYETLALGRDLADAAGAPLEAVLLGHNVRRLADTLGRADSVLCLDHPLLAEPEAGMYADVLAPLVAEREPAALLIPLTNISLGIGTLVAGELRLPAVNFCRDVRWVNGKLQALCILYGGKVEAEVTPRGAPAVLGIWPGARPADKGRSGHLPAIEQVTVSPDGASSVRWRSYSGPPPDAVDIAQQQVLVAVGRGVQSKECLALAESFAAAVGGALCGSRSLVDRGWLPPSRQVGKSGLTVRPKVYIALGISGAPEHVEGIRESECIIAVNTDPRAPIFDIADYGIVADVAEALPALTCVIQTARAMPAHH